MFTSVEDFAPKTPVEPAKASGGDLFSSVDNFAPSKPQSNSFASVGDFAPGKTPAKSASGLPTLESLSDKTKAVDLSALYPNTKGKIVGSIPGLAVDLKSTIEGQEKYLTDLGEKITAQQKTVNQKDPKAVQAFNESVKEYNQVFDSYTQNKSDLGDKENKDSLTKHPVVAKLTGGKTLGGFVHDIFGGLPEASEKVSAFINRPLTKASNFLSNTNFIKESAAGMNEGSGQVATQILQKFADLSGTHVFQGMTAGLYKAPETGQKDDFVDTVFKGLSEGLGAIIGFKSIGAFLPTARATTVITGLVERFPLVGKYLTPYVGDAVDVAAGMGVQTQLNPDLAGDLTRRSKVLLTTIAEAPVYAALGILKSAKASVPASFTLGFGMSKLSGSSNKDAIASGFTFALMDGIARAEGSRGFSPEEIKLKMREEAFNILNEHATDVKLTENSTLEQIRAAYNRAVHQNHPDLGGSKEALEATKTAYDILSDGAVSKSDKYITPEEQSAEEVHQEIMDVVNTHGPDVAREGLKDSLGLDHSTADKLVQSAVTKEARDNPDKVAEDELQKILEDKKPKEETSVSQKAFDSIKENGGVTITTEGNIPTKGYAYAPAKNTEFSISEAEFTPQHLDDYAKEHAEALAQDGAHIGGWISEGKVYLDVSRVGKPSAKTIEEAQANQQLAVFDLEHFKEISTGQLADNKYTKIDEASNIHDKHQREISGTSVEGGDGGVRQIPESKEGGDGKNGEGSQPKEVAPATSRMTTFEGTGETKTRGLSRGVDASAVEKQLTEHFGDLPEYNQLKIKDVSEKATSLVTADYDRAKRIAMGHEESLEGVPPEAVFIAVQNKAFADGDLQTIRDLATSSTLISEATTMGQRLRILAERDPESPVTAHTEVIKEKEKVFEKKTKKKASVEKKKVVNELKEVKKKSAPKLKDWNSFIESITC